MSNDDKIQELGNAVMRLLAVLVQPDNGHHYCRWCDAGTSNGWQHAGYCAYQRRCTEIENARDFARAALSGVKLTARAEPGVSPVAEPQQ